MYQYRHLTPEQQRELVEERRQQGFPDHAPPHPYRFEGHYLITAATFEHQPFMLADERRTSFMTEMLESLNTSYVDILSWVFLPNHYHLLLWTDDLKRTGILIGQQHGRSSRAWNLEEHSPGRKRWYRYADRAIRNERHYWATVNYIHYNPVKHRYVESPYDWSTCSLHWYLTTNGRPWLRDLWKEYPVQSYGKEWDNY